MKRWLISVLIVIAVLTVSVIPVLAITRGNNGGSCQASDCTKKQCNRGEGFTDEDGDGVCDNQNTQCNRGEGFTDEDGDGVCDNQNVQCSDSESAQRSCGNRGKCHGKMKKAS
jgi:hypothetical protein